MSEKIISSAPTKKASTIAASVVTRSDQGNLRRGRGLLAELVEGAPSTGSGRVPWYSGHGCSSSEASKAASSSAWVVTDALARASSVGTPAIIRPSTSREVSGGTMPTIRPRYITAIRSASATTSSSSVDTISTAVPRSRSATSR